MITTRHAPTECYLITMFESEKSMKEPAVELIPDTLGKEEYEVLTEFDYGPGRADLVFVNVSEPYWERRVNQLELDTPIQSKNALVSFLQLHSRTGPVTEDYFYELGALRRRYKRESLDWLKENGFVEETDRGKIRTTRDLRRHVTTTVAVELKRRKWQKAIKQAARGRSFADYKYVALSHNNIQPALDNIGNFRNQNIGLLSIDRDGDCHIHFEPERGEPHSELCRWKINEVTLTELSA